MNYIIFDLEFNQDYYLKKENKPIIASKCPFEIIQLGALKLDEKFQVISTIDRLIKPEIYTTIHPYVKEITGLTMDKLNTGIPFKEVYKEFVKIAKGEENILCVWGMSDIKELFRNIVYHELNTDEMPTEYINIQSYASKHFNYPKGINVGLSNAVELLNIPLNNYFHDAFNDAHYTAEVFKKIYSKKIKSKIYTKDNYIRPDRQPTAKKTTDTYNLIKQIEKMFKREMTEDEKSIIKLAYIMGKTNQFEIETPNK